MAKQLDSDLSEIPTMLGNCREPTQGIAYAIIMLL